MSNAWLLLPVTEHGGKEVIHVSPQDEWINRLVCDASRGTLSSNKNVAEMFELFKQAKIEARENLAEQQVVEQNEFLAAASAGRAALGLSDSDGEKDAADDAAGKVEPRRPERLSKTRKRAAFLNINIQGHQLRVANDLQRTHIEATAEAVQVVIDLFKEANNVHVAKPEKPKAAEEAGKVFYQFRNNCFCVVYHDAEGKRCQTRKNLTVPSKSPTGEPLGKAEYETAVAQTRDAAKRLWDTLDKSDAARFFPS